METRQNEIWGLLIVGYLFLAGLGSGAFAVAAGLDLQTGGQTRGMTNIGACICLLCVGLGAFLLLLDLGVPQRAFHLIRNPSSLISAGTVILSTLLLLAAITITLGFSSLGRDPGAYRILLILSLLFALATSIYVGFLLAVVKCRPFWNTPLLPLLFVTSSLSTGVSALTLVSAAAGLDVPAAAAAILTTGEWWLLALEFLMVAFYVVIMENSLPQAKASVRRLVAGDLAAPFWIGVVVAGLIVPLTIMAAPGSLPPAVLSLSVLTGGFSLRYCVLFAGGRALLPGETPEAAYVR